MNEELKKKLDERLIKGEITTEEYKKILETIDSNDPITSNSDSNKEINESNDKKINNSTFDNISQYNDEKGFFKKLSDGDFGLAKTFWLYGVVVSVIEGALQRAIIVGMGKNGFLLIFLIQLIFSIYYLFFQLPGLWRAAKKYEGAKIWAVLAQIIVVIDMITVPLSLLYMLVLLIQVGI